MRSEKINSLFKNLFSVFIVVFIMNIVFYPKKSAAYVQEALNICYLVIIPSLFPFMIFSKIFMNTTLFYSLVRILDKPAKFLFNISGEYAGAFLVGILSGFPSGVKNTADIYNETKTNKKDAERTLGFCNCASVSFVISAVGLMVFKDAKTGFVLYGVHVLSAILTGIVLRFIFKEKDEESASPYMYEGKKRKTVAVSRNIADSISDSVSGIIQICGIIICFFVMANILTDVAEMIGGDIFGREANIKTAEFIFSAVLELSSGVKMLASASFSPMAKFILASLILSLSGVSVHIQNINILRETDLSLKPYFTGKIISVIISLALSFIAYPLTGMNANVNTYFTYGYDAAVAANVSGSGYMVYFVFTMVASLLTLASALLLAFAAGLINKKIKNNKNKTEVEYL